MARACLFQLNHEVNHTKENEQNILIRILT